ncbi:hypothetical protein PsYK624_014890 [Phanerochaete sordida]|uniref:Uncharacterized protein n=1 Tax=Phanerochaete sordida TaxID=48140 RepID=A0A9P3G0C7_9APHY|nr:hypothetical protein PsYK624_014890 [Phanerochaete sordida]
MKHPERNPLSDRMCSLTAICCCYQSSLLANRDPVFSGTETQGQMGVLRVGRSLPRQVQATECLLCARRLLRREDLKPRVCGGEDPL